MRVVAEALTRLKRKKLDVFDVGQALGRPHRISCDYNATDQAIWEHGEKITRVMRKVSGAGGGGGGGVRGGG